MKRFFIFIACLLGLLTSPAQAAAPGLPNVEREAPDDKVGRQEIYDKIRSAIAAKDFVGLSALETDFRKSRARLPSGQWKLVVFHAGLQAYLAEGLRRTDNCQYRDEPFLRQWSAATPRNPAPGITHAALLMTKAWCIRGDGYANTVTAANWHGFNDNVEAAFKALKTRRKWASIDPEFYAVEIETLRAKGVGEDVSRSVLDEAMQREPEYDRTFENAAWSYMPQWGGSYPLLEQFARHASEQTGSKALYAQIFWNLESCGCRLIDKAADWPMLKEAMRDLYSHYPVRQNGQKFADLACRLNDREEGRAYIRALHPEAVDENSFTALFATCDSRGRAASRLNRD